MTAQALCLLGLGPPAPGALDELASRVSRRVALACHTGTLHAIELPRLAGRDQLDADGLLALLEAREQPPGWLSVGVTATDIAIPIFTFVFGRARQNGRAALISTARLTPEFYGLPPDPELVARRAVAEVLHELGHVAGLDHCREASCLMRFAGNIQLVDSRGERFCDACLERVPHWLRG